MANNFVRAHIINTKRPHLKCGRFHILPFEKLNKAPFPAPPGFRGFGVPKATPCPLWLRTIHWIVRLTRRAPRNLSNTSPNALRNKWDWSHWDVAILYKNILLAPGTPCRHPHPVPCSHYATSVLGASQLVPQNSRTKCRPGHSRYSALRSSPASPTSALPKATASFALATGNSLDCHFNASRPASRFRLRISESAYLLRYGQAELFNMLATRSVQISRFLNVCVVF